MSNRPTAPSPRPGVPALDVPQRRLVGRGGRRVAAIARERREWHVARAWRVTALRHMRRQAHAPAAPLTPRPLCEPLQVSQSLVQPTAPSKKGKSKHAPKPRSPFTLALTSSIQLVE